MQGYSISPREMLLSFWRNRNLIATLVKRDIASRYRGSLLGCTWAVFHPVLMLTIYAFVFGVVFKTRWGGAEGGQAEFAVVLFVGLLVFNLFSECINRSPSLLVENANYVKKVVFPLEIMPWVVLGGGLFNLLLGVLVWLAFYFFFIGVPPLSLVLLPICLLPFVLMINGLAWGLSSLGVYLRDLKQITTVLTSMLLFLSPVFYPVEALPEKFRWVMALNPITPAVEMSRHVLVVGGVPDWLGFVQYLIICALVGWLGFAWFQKTRQGFADVL